MSDLSLAVQLLEQGHHVAAARELEKILSENIDDIAAWRLLAQAVSEPIERKECYEHVLRLDPTDQEAIRQLGLLEPGREKPGAVLPFFDEDLAEFSTAPQRVETPAFLQEGDGGQTMPTDSPEPPTPEQSKAAEASLFDEEDDQPGPAAKGLFENDAVFYTLIVLLVVFVTVIVLVLTNSNILTLIQSIFS